MKKKILFIILGILVGILVIFTTLFLIFRIKSDNPYLGKWVYKYTYTEKGKLKYTEEDGMESYIKLKKNNIYKWGDHNSDITGTGFWFETKDYIYLSEGEYLYKQDDGSLKTNMKDGKKILWKYDYYHILIKK